MADPALFIAVSMKFRNKTPKKIVERARMQKIQKKKKKIVGNNKNLYITFMFCVGVTGGFPVVLFFLFLYYYLLKNILKSTKYPRHTKYE